MYLLETAVCAAGHHHASSDASTVADFAAPTDSKLAQEGWAAF
jgi:hypothetical protein